MKHFRRSKYNILYRTGVKQTTKAIRRWIKTGKNPFSCLRKPKTCFQKKYRKYVRKA